MASVNISPETWALIFERLTPVQLARVLKAPPEKPLTPKQIERRRLAEEYWAALESQQKEQDRWQRT